MYTKTKTPANYLMSIPIERYSEHAHRQDVAGQGTLGASDIICMYKRGPNGPTFSVGKLDETSHPNNFLSGAFNNHPFQSRQALSTGA